MKTIALIDSNTKGHHLMYLQYISLSFLECGHFVYAITAEYIELQKWVENKIPEYSQRIKVIKVNDVKNNFFLGLINKPNLLFSISRWIQAYFLIQTKISLKPDLVFFSKIDNYFSYYIPSSFIDIFFRYAWSGIYFDPSKHKKKNVAHSRIAQSKNCQGLFLLDELSLNHVLGETNNSVRYFPDFTDESLPDYSHPILSEIKKKAQNRKIIGLLGALSKRKGILTLLQASQVLPKNEFFFIFIGELDLNTFTSIDEKNLIDTFISQQQDNVYFYTERIQLETHFNAFIEICNILFAAYIDFSGSSNLLTKAALFQKPIIVSERFYMGQMVTKYQIGVTIPENSAEACAQAIKWLMSDEYKDKISSGQIQPQHSEYHKKNSLFELDKVLKSLIH